MHQTNSSLKETKTITITINSDRSDEMIEGLKMISSKYNLCAGSIIQLRDLERYNIVCLFDDSGSMSTKITKNLVDNPFEKIQTRWNIQHQIAKQITEIACCLDADGIDVFFLNRSPIKNMTDPSILDNIFKTLPDGCTPLLERYIEIMENTKKSEKPTLIIVLTDGSQNKIKDDQVIDNTDEFIQYIKTRKNPQKTPTMIVSCSDVNYEVE